MWDFSLLDVFCGSVPICSARDGIPLSHTGPVCLWITSLADQNLCFLIEAPDTVMLGVSLGVRDGVVGDPKAELVISCQEWGREMLKSHDVSVSLKSAWYL